MFNVIGYHDHTIIIWIFYNILFYFWHQAILEHIALLTICTYHVLLFFCFLRVTENWQKSKNSFLIYWIVRDAYVVGRIMAPHNISTS